MTSIEPLRQDIENPNRLKRHSAGLRFWHWSNTIVITGSLLTVLLNSTLLDPRSNAEFVLSELQRAGANVSAKQAGSVSHGLEEKVWELHIYFGYFLAALFLFRILLEIFQRRDHKFIAGLKKAWKHYSSAEIGTKLARHELTVKVLYLVFYLSLTILTLTGLIMVFKNELGIPRDISHSIKEVHGFCMYVVLGFIVLHIAGVVLAERKDSKGIVSDMINGGLQD
jgi:cytochrome b561